MPKNMATTRSARRRDARVSERSVGPPTPRQNIIRRILCPTDFSETSRRALQWAAGLALRHDAEVTVLHVVPLWPTTDQYPPAVEPSTLAPISHAEIVAELKRFAQQAFRGEASVKCVVRSGQPVDEILKAAARANLVVLGTHGRRGFEKWAMGSVTERLLHRAPCPVLTTTLRGAATPRIRTILCASDFSGASRSALRSAVSLAGTANARLVLLHVLDWGPGDEFPRYVHHVDMAQYRRFLETHALRQLAKAVPTSALRLHREEVVTKGKPHEEILKVARAKGADLIVLGVHSRNGLDLAFFGSTANRVVRDSSCPVLTVRGRAFGYRAQARRE